MKYRIYILLLLTTLFIGINKTYAAEDKCYYIGDEFKATFDFNNGGQRVYVDLIGQNPDHDEEDILNWRPDLYRSNKTYSGDKFDNLYTGASDAKQNGTCPEYLVIQNCQGKWETGSIIGLIVNPVDQYRIWGTNDITQAQTAVDGINSVNKCIGRYATYKHTDGTRITPEEYYSTLISPDSGGTPIDMTNPEIACNAIFGDKDYAGETDVDLNGNGEIDPPSIAYMINLVLKYVRIIVPILIIVLGTIDFARAVVADKEDEMKKAQVTFVKRIIAGVAVFFVPIIVNIVMGLADIVWEGLDLSHCNLP